MRYLPLRVVVISVLIVIGLSRLPVASNAAPSELCPRVRIYCPDVLRGADPLIFTADIVGGDDIAKLTFKWTVSAGTIVGGQGTTSILVDTTDLRQVRVKATLEIGGLPRSCDKRVTNATEVEGPIVEGNRPVDEYGDINFEDEKARLDYFVIELLNNPRARGYITVYGGRRARPNEARLRAVRAKTYLVMRRGIDARRIVIVDGGYREELTVVLHVVPAGVAPPVPWPTLDAREVKISSSGKNARRRVRVRQ